MNNTRFKFASHPLKNPLQGYFIKTQPSNKYPTGKVLACGPNKEEIFKKFADLEKALNEMNDPVTLIHIEDLQGNRLT